MTGELPSADSRPVLRSDTVALQLWRDRLAAWRVTRIDVPAEDHLFDVTQGRLRCEGRWGQPVGAISVGRGGGGLLAGPQGATVLRFIGDAASRSHRAGGCLAPRAASAPCRPAPEVIMSSAFLRPTGIAGPEPIQQVP